VSEVLRDWPERAALHEQRVREFLHDHRDPAGEPHPVWDFLFTYYSLRPGQLTCWHPGYGVLLPGAEAIRRYRNRTGYMVCGDGVTVSDDYLARRSDTVAFIEGLLAATAGRPAQFNCFGMHEWAMVYRSDTVRHTRVPLRLGAPGTDAVVESMPLRCSHFDAYRFFTADARPRNALALARAGQVGHEQPGCIHANMDLFKWACKLGPLVAAELTMDCLVLAADARELDMRASPYDLSGYGFAAIRIEEPAGRAEYVRRQTEIASRAAVLRTALLARCRALFGPSQRAGRAVTDR